MSQEEGYGRNGKMSMADTTRPHERILNLPEQLPEQLRSVLQNLERKDIAALVHALIKELIPADAESVFSIRNPYDPTDVAGYYSPYLHFLKSDPGTKDWLEQVRERVETQQDLTSEEVLNQILSD